MEIKKEIWGGEFCTDGRYFKAVSDRSDKKVIEKNVKWQGRVGDIR